MKCLKEKCIHQEVCDFYRQEGADGFTMNCPFHEEERSHGEWIPCSERLPKEDDGYRVLVTVCIPNRPLDIMILPTSTIKEVFEEGHISAWMPLPTPYMKEGEAE